MNFEHVDLIPALARARQQELIEEAAERRIVRQAKEGHASRGGVSRVFRRDPAS